MTNFEAIKDGTNTSWNELIERLDIEDMAELISEISCNYCICKYYCDNHRDYKNSSCQQTIKNWLSEEI